MITDTDRDVISDPTEGVCAAQPWTGVQTLAVDARLVLGTVRVHDTLWPAVGGRSYHFRQTGAVAAVADLSGRVAVGTARVRLARVVGGRKLG